MLSLFRKKPYIHFWSIYNDLEKVEPITKAVKTMPDWFKNLKAYPNQDPLVDAGTVKMCPSFIQYYKSLYTLKLWCDVKLVIDDDYYEWYTPDGRFSFDAHNKVQMKDHLPEHEKNNTKIILKANCPWRCKTSKNYMLMQLPCTYHYNDLFDVPPGFIQTHTYHELNPQMIFRKKGTFLLERGIPICHYLLVHNEEVDFKVMSRAEHFKIDPTYEDIMKTKFQRSMKEKLHDEPSEN